MATPTPPCTTDQASETKDVVDLSFLIRHARRANTEVSPQPSSEMESKDSTVSQRKIVWESPIRQNQNKMIGKRMNRQDSLSLQKGFRNIASSFSLLGDTLGTAIEEGLNLVETKASSLAYMQPRGTCLKKILDTAVPKKLTSPAKVQESADKKSGLTTDTQLKASRDVAMAMATKAKLLLRELKGLKADLAFTRDRCSQIEEENKRLRECADKDLGHEDDDLVRLQLEALLEEKARLVQENAAYARENQFLHEVMQYRQLTLRDVALLDESLMSDVARLDVEAPVDMEIWPAQTLEKYISALE